MSCELAYLSFQANANYGTLLIDFDLDYIELDMAFYETLMSLGSNQFIYIYNAD